MGVPKKLTARIDRFDTFSEFRAKATMCNSIRDSWVYFIRTYKQFLFYRMKRIYRREKERSHLEGIPGVIPGNVDKIHGIYREYK